VKTLQRRLIELGWLGGKVTGSYDELTAAAVSAFQRKTSGLWEDGIAGPDTLRALYSSNAARGTNAISVSSETLEMGSEGSDVRTLQQKLKDLGYLSGSVDGKFGVATEAAVIAFQKNNNLTADGKAGTATQSKLYSGSAKKSTGTQAKISTDTSSGRDTSGIASTGYVTLENGSTGDQVRTLQKRLKELGYYTGSVDGSYGEGTVAAVMAFQLRNNLTVDGKAGPATQRVLYGSKSSINYPSMRQGEEGTSVRNLQYTLYELGYYTGAIDGIYGQTTADAVRAFQIENKLSPVDGVAGTQTLNRLYSSDAISATAYSANYETAQSGDKGELVVEIQDCLVQMGFLEEINGVYDDVTVEAVKAFQRANGLTADGKCGELTLQVLFGY
jgi:Putative peptidoglycan-binding domain-containing protein